VENTARAWALAWSVLCGADDSGDANLGMGGVMLASTDWHGGLRDRELLIPEQQREVTASAALAVVDRVKKLIFPIHGLAV
jgi:hypothetical protein